MNPNRCSRDVVIWRKRDTLDCSVYPGAVVASFTGAPSFRTALSHSVARGNADDLPGRGKRPPLAGFDVGDPCSIPVHDDDYAMFVQGTDAA